MLAALAGTPLSSAAAAAGLAATELADAIELYTAAGRAALETPTSASCWYQVHVRFADWHRAETVVAGHLWPHLQAAKAQAIITSWWYIRKAPCWRLRFRAGPGGASRVKEWLGPVLDELAASNLVTAWWPSIYEPEARAFGGAAGIDAAHRLFHADSTGIIEYLRRTDSAVSGASPIGRSELSILLCSTLLRAARQDWHEQGDVWSRVARMRARRSDTPAERLRRTTSKVHRLMSVDACGATARNVATLALAQPWLNAFHQAGEAIGAAAHNGTLERGVRDVLAHHIVFHWNRLGLGTTAQSVLAWAALDATLGPLPDDGEGTSNVVGA